MFISKSKSFTLIEFLVVVAIIGLMSSIMIINYSGQKPKDLEEQAVLQFVSDLRRAQNMAMAVIDCDGVQDQYCVYNILTQNYNITCYSQNFELPMAIDETGEVCFYPITETNPVLTADEKTFNIGETEINIKSNGQIIY